MINKIFGRRKVNKRLSLIRFIQQVIEDKVMELKKKGESGPRAHLWFLAIKELYTDKKPKDRLSYLVSKGYMKNLIEQSDGLIEEKLEELRRRGVKDGGVIGGLQFLAIEELCEEKEIALGRIKEEELVRAKHGNCMVAACIDDLECKIQTDKILRKEAHKQTGRYLTNYNLFRDALNQVYDQKRKDLLHKSKSEVGINFPFQRGYKLDTERVINLYKTTENFAIIYFPSLQSIYHALKVIDVDAGYVIAEHLDEISEISLGKARIQDLISKNEEIIVVMDEGPSRELTEGELSDLSIPLHEASLLMPELLELEPEYESTVRLDLFIGTVNEEIEKRKKELLEEGKWEELDKLEDTKTIFKVKLEKFKNFYFSEVMYYTMILYKSRLGEYYNFLFFLGLDDEYAYGPKNRKVPLSYCIDESEEFFLVTPRRIKEKYFKEEKELSEEYMRTMDMVYKYKPYK
ncbi:hypothetical protein KAW50_05855 [candidate division WOR-3 bacterium]|nr:hypothetical protein [candidate division WOR-3 bacterium]